MNAAEVLAKYWNKTIPVNPAKIALEMKVVVLADPDLEARNESGHYHRQGGLSKRATITFNPFESSTRQRFTIAHELGHHVLGHEDAPRETPQAFTMRADPNERAANNFAAELLMPREAIEHYIDVKNITDVPRLAAIFEVSRAAMLYRLLNLGYDVD